MMVSGANILLLIRDQGESGLIQGVLSGWGAQAQIVNDTGSAMELLKERKFSGVFLGADGPLEQSFEIVKQVRTSASNRKTPVILVADSRSSGKLLQAYKVGVTFTLLRPLNEKKLTQTLSLVRGSMLAEQRNYQRVFVALSVRLRTTAGPNEGESINISRTGILFRAAHPLQASQTVEMKILLPGDPAAISASGDVVRSDPDGRTAVRFSRLPVDDLERLKSFLASHAAVRASAAH